ncbi:MAG: outer membrane protein assembly factor BamB, partial [Candidatus Paceibacteria bacterium]
MKRQATRHTDGTRGRVLRVLVRLCIGWLCVGWLALPGLSLALAQAEPEEEKPQEVLGFSIPNTRIAQVRMQHATDHIAAKRWNEAIAELQALIETHGSELIPSEDEQENSARVFRGAAGWAAEQLVGLPEDARRLYERRYGPASTAALALARRQSNRQALSAVAERWPATQAAIGAWWTLGDLELEYGNHVLARRAWSRALGLRLAPTSARFKAGFDGESLSLWEDRLERLDATDTASVLGERERAAFAISSLSEENPISEGQPFSSPMRGNLRLPGTGEGAHGAPGPGASSWPRPFRLPAGSPFERGMHNLFPVRMGDLVFISDSLQLFAIHAYSGALVWSSELSKGWLELGDDRQEFYKGISRQDTMIAPAASENIVVSAHQVPVSDIHNEEFRRIAITTVIPDRRLYAYDTQSGRELWNHHPPPGWDGESGDFVDRMSVAGPPVVSGSRIFAPYYRMYGRIEFYVACFDLASGERLWSTQLVSGQRELNMFARSEREFSAPPVRVEGDRILVLTQLGAVAAIDLFTGKILWETLYDQIAPPQRSHFGAQPIKNIWRNAAPVVADGVVIATPFDCLDLLGFDLEDGAALWSVRHERIDRIAGQSRSEIDLLLGADDRTVYLGSWPVLALRAQGGLHREAPTDLAWRYPGGEIEGLEYTTARPLLLDDRVLIPTRAERIDVDRFGGGRRHKSLPWKGGRNGNLLVEDGTLYALTTQSLDGYFEWDMLLARGQRDYEEAGQDFTSSLYLSSLLVERSRTELEAGRTVLARDWLAQAEEILDPFLEEKLTSSALESQMHSLLRMRGKVFVDLADGATAASAL